MFIVNENGGNFISAFSPDLDWSRKSFFFFFFGFANCIFSLPYSTCIDQVFIFYFVKKQDLPR